MNRKITKTMAENASYKMAEQAYSQKIEEAYQRVYTTAENLVRKYVPEPVITCVNKYDKFFSYWTKWASISTIIQKNGYTTSATSVKGKLTFKIPSGSSCIKVDGKEYDALLKLDCRRKVLESQRDEFKEKVRSALIALRTEKAVEMELPEAMKYLEFPEVKSVPAPIYKNLRNTIKTLTQD